MRHLLLFVLLTSPLLAQDMTAVAAAEVGCGPKEFRLDAKQDATQHPTPAPAEGKAVVYLTQDFGHSQYIKRYGLTRVGLDGSWAGANRGNSYVYFEVTPGEHHLCVNWVSHFEQLSSAVALANFTAEAGKSYYFRVRSFFADQNFMFNLDPVNSDEGRLLVALSTYSVLQTKQPPKAQGK